jgi:hypothetical protein
MSRVAFKAKFSKVLGNTVSDVASIRTGPDELMDRYKRESEQAQKAFSRASGLASLKKLTALAKNALGDAIVSAMEALEGGIRNSIADLRGKLLGFLSTLQPAFVHVVRYLAVSFLHSLLTKRVALLNALRRDTEYIIQTLNSVLIAELGIDPLLRSRIQAALNKIRQAQLILGREANRPVPRQDQMIRAQTLVNKAVEDLDFGMTKAARDLPIRIAKIFFKHGKTLKISTQKKLSKSVVDAFPDLLDDLKEAFADQPQIYEKIVADIIQSTGIGGYIRAHLSVVMLAGPIANLIKYLPIPVPLAAATVFQYGTQQAKKGPEWLNRLLPAKGEINIPEALEKLRRDALDKLGPRWGFLIPGPPPKSLGYPEDGVSLNILNLQIVIAELAVLSLAGKDNLFKDLAENWKGDITPIVEELDRVAKEMKDSQSLDTTAASAKIPDWVRRLNTQSRALDPLIVADVSLTIGGKSVVISSPKLRDGFTEAEIKFNLLAGAGGRLDTLTEIPTRPAMEAFLTHSRLNGFVYGSLFVYIQSTQKRIGTVAALQGLRVLLRKAAREDSMTISMAQDYLQTIRALPNFQILLEAWNGLLPKEEINKQFDSLAGKGVDLRNGNIMGMDPTMLLALKQTKRFKLPKFREKVNDLGISSLMEQADISEEEYLEIERAKERERDLAYLNSQSKFIGQQVA